MSTEGPHDSSAEACEFLRIGEVANTAVNQRVQVAGLVATLRKRVTIYHGELVERLPRLRNATTE